MTTTDIDPFAGSTRTPSLSFKDAPIGTVYEGVVVEAPTLVQSRDYDTGEPAFWPAKPGQEPQPKMSVVLVLSIDDEERSVWAQKPSALFAAIGEAQKAAGKRIEVGGVLAIKYTGDKPNEKNPRLNPAKQYAARYTPPAAQPTADPWASSAANTAAPASAAASDDPPF